jgi:NTP pyrophosphatase (non-canonical NTP hydrolase)
MFQQGNRVVVNPSINPQALIGELTYLELWLEAQTLGTILTVEEVRDPADPKTLVQCSGWADDDLWWIPAYLIRPITIAEGVAFMNESFCNAPLNPDHVDNFWTKMETQAKVTLEEAKEILEAVEERNLTKLRDGVADTLVTALGCAHLASIDVEADMDAVLSSNLSKVSKTEENAALTVQYYADVVGISTRVYDCPTFEGYIIKVDGEQTGLDGKLYPNGKFLKCRVGFKEPVLN